MKYIKQTNRKQKSGKIIRKNPVALVLPAIPVIAEGVAALWAATVSAAPYIVAAFTTGATVGLIERKLNADKAKVDKISKSIPKTIDLPKPLDWLTRSKEKAKGKTQRIPKTTYPIEPIPTPPQKPDMDWLKKFVEWFQKGVELNPLKTLQTTLEFIKKAPRQLLDFVSKGLTRLDAWEKANPWKFRLFLFIWIVYLSPQLAKLVDYIDGSVEPFYKDTTLINLSKTLDRNVDAYPFLKNLNLVDNSDLVILNMRPSLQNKYPNVLARSVYSYQIRSNQDLQACASACLTNIKTYHNDAIGEHNTIPIPKALSKKYFDEMEFIPADPFSFKVLQGMKSNCDITTMYHLGDNRADLQYVERQQNNWLSMVFGFGALSRDFTSQALRTQVFTPNNRFLLSLAASVTISKARKYWRDRYDLSCTIASEIPGLAQAKKVMNNLPNIFDIGDRNVPYVEENWTWANFAMLESLVPTNQGSYLPSALKPAFYYDVLQFIQDRTLSKTVRNLQETDVGRQKLQNTEILYSQNILPIKKDVSPLETQRILSNLMWVLINDTKKLKTTPIDQPYYLKNFDKSYQPNPKAQKVGQIYSNKLDAMLQVAIENYLFEQLGFRADEMDAIPETTLYAYFKFSLGLIQLTNAFEQGLSNENFVVGLKSLFGYLKDTSASAVAKVVEDYAIVYVSKLLENRVTALKSQTMVVVFMGLLDLIMPDFIRKYFVDWIFFNQDQSQVLEDFYIQFVDLFVDYAIFSKDEVADSNGIIYDRILIPNLEKVDQQGYLDFLYQISQADSSRILSGIIFFENAKV